MLVRHCQLHVQNLRYGFERGLAHCVEGVLHRFAVVFCKTIDERFTQLAPQLLEG